MIAGWSQAKILELWRYYQVGVLNTLFGFGVYSGFVALGLNLYVAQFLSHFAGVAFNYFSYSRHVFTGAGPVKFRFILSYIGNYLLGLGALAAIAQFVPSPYLAGFLAVVIVSLINYFVLKHLVFKRQAA
jgi:putative flippase GtrA